MTTFHLTMATLEQAYAYARYFAEKRDVSAALFGLLFLIVCIAPALLWDIVRLVTAASPKVSFRASP